MDARIVRNAHSRTPHPFNAPDRVYGRTGGLVAAMVAAGGAPREIGRADSRIIGDVAGYDDLEGLIGLFDDVGDFDDVGEIGRKHRHKAKVANRYLSRHGLVAMPMDQARLASTLARRQAQQQASLYADANGVPMTADDALATTGQRELYLPGSAYVSLAAAVNSTAIISVTVQRPIQLHRIILSIVDSTTGADATPSVGVTSILIGVRPIFNAAGVAPAIAFANNSVGVKILAPAARVGENVTINLIRVATVTNPSTAGAWASGVSAQ